jgi:hypothetical protein
MNSSLLFNDLDANTYDKSLSSWHPSLESNTWTSSNSYEQFLNKKLNENISP